MSAVHDFVRTSGLDDQAYVPVTTPFLNNINKIIITTNNNKT